MTTEATPSVDRPPFNPICISTVDFWSKTADEREPSFKILRDERPISWHPPIEGTMMPPPVDGVWAATRHEDIEYISKNPKLFCSGQGTQVEAFPQELLVAAESFLSMDGEEHSSLRRLISSVFTPRRLSIIRDQVNEQAKKAVDELLQTKEGDFVEQFAKKLPMWTIYEMVGLPPEKREEATRLADGMPAWADPEVAAGREPAQVVAESLIGLRAIAMELADQRRAEPADDLMTQLVQAEVNGRQLTNDEIGAFFVLLSVAGNDTTRNTTSIATMALQQFPDQKELLLNDFDGHIHTAIEEFVRWATPVMTFRRTVTEDTVLRDQELKKGDWILMVYSSGNRDERVFTDPHKLDIRRKPNPHVAFGGGGPHYCMGAFLAKMQLEAIFRELLFRAPNLRVGEPRYLRSNFLRAVKALPYTLD